MKLLLPKNLDLNTLIKDELPYTYLTNTSGIIKMCIKKGRVLRKLIPTIQYFLSVCICTDEAQGDFRTTGFKRIRITDVQHVMSYKKMKQIIHFLVEQHIIEVIGITEFITVQGQQFGINAKYFKLLTPYDGDTQIQEIYIKTERKVVINPKAKQLIEMQEIARLSQVPTAASVPVFRRMNPSRAPSPQFQWRSLFPLTVMPLSGPSSTMT